MSNDHDRYRENGVWVPFYAWGDLGGAGAITTLPIGDEAAGRQRQPVGFRGAAPGASLDDRGLPRVRVKAGSAHA